MEEDKEDVIFTKRKITRLDTNEEFDAEIARMDETNDSQESTVTAAKLKSGNWRGDDSLSFVKSEETKAPDAEDDFTTRIMATKDGDIWLIPPDGKSPVELSRVQLSTQQLADIDKVKDKADKSELSGHMNSVSAHSPSQVGAEPAFTTLPLTKLPTSSTANRILKIKTANSAPAYSQVELGTDVSGTLQLINGGTGATTAATARTSLGVPPTSHSSTATTYGVGTAANYGHVKTVNGLTQSSNSDGTALAAYQGYVLNNTKANESGIPRISVPTSITGGTMYYRRDPVSRVQELWLTGTTNSSGSITFTWGENYKFSEDPLIVSSQINVSSSATTNTQGTGKRVTLSTTSIAMVFTYVAGGGSSSALSAQCYIYLMGKY